jgi:hypothetical protein
MSARINKDGVLLDEHPYYFNLLWQNHFMIHIGYVGEKLFEPLEESKKYGEDSFKIEILYSGLDGKTFKVTYREYKNDIARSAFYQVKDMQAPENPCVDSSILSLGICVCKGLAKYTNSFFMFCYHFAPIPSHTSLKQDEISRHCFYFKLLKL